MIAATTPRGLRRSRKRPAASSWTTRAGRSNDGQCLHEGDRACDLSLGMRQRLALLRREQPRELGGVLGKIGSDRQQLLASSGEVEARPGRKGCLRRRHRRIQLCQIGARALGDDCLRGGVDDWHGGRAGDGTSSDLQVICVHVTSRLPCLSRTLDVG